MRRDLSKPDGARVDYLSPSFYSATGAPRGLGMSALMAMCIHPDDLPRVMRQWATVRDGLWSFSCHYRALVHGDWRVHAMRADYAGADEYGPTWVAIALDVHDSVVHNNSAPVLARSPGIANARARDVGAGPMSDRALALVHAEAMDAMATRLSESAKALSRQADNLRSGRSAMSNGQHDDDSSRGIRKSAKELVLDAARLLAMTG